MIWANVEIPGKIMFSVSDITMVSNRSLKDPTSEKWK